MTKIKSILLLPFLIFGLKNTEINADFHNDSTVSQKQYILIEQNNNHKNNLDVSSFIEHYDFYQYKVGNIDYFVADTLNSEKFMKNIVHIKIINNPNLYRFETNIDYKDKFVLELLTMDNDLLEKHYYILSDDDYNKIKRKVLPINNKKIKNNIITALNIEYDFKSKENNTSINQFNYFGTDNSSTNSQESLDHFLNIKNTPKNMIELGLPTSGSSELIYDSDASICNIIPKNVFTKNGTYTQTGTEWGYYAKTYTDYDQNKITSLFIYDVIMEKADSFEPTLISVKPVLSQNFKYDADIDLVIEDVENNYCFANPELKSIIQYEKINGDLNGIDHPNPTEMGYSSNSDNGYIFHNWLAKYTGVGKNYNNDVKNAVNCISLIIETGFSLIPIPGNSLLSELAVSAIVSPIVDLPSAYFQDALVQEPTASYSKTNGKYVFNRSYISGLSRFSDYQKANKMNKYLEIRPLDSTTSYDDKTNRVNPLLFKDNSDSVDYTISYLSKDGYNNYTALVAFDIQLEIFNDNSSLFNQNPEYLGTINNSFASWLGRDVKSQLINAQSNKSYYTVCGSTSSQTVEFFPKVTGNYKFVLSDCLSYTTLSLGNSSVTSGAKVYIDAWGQQRKKANQKTICLSQSLIKGQKYTLTISRKNTVSNVKAYGGAKLNILFNNGIINITTASDYAKNYASKTYNYNGESYFYKFIPKNDGLFSFNLNSNSLSYKKYSVFILNDKFEIISEYSSTNKNFGLRLSLLENDTYYVLIRTSSTTNESIKLNIWYGSYIPNINSRISKKTIFITNYSTIKTKTFLTIQKVSGTYKISSFWDNTTTSPIFSPVSFKLFDSNNELIISNKDITGIWQNFSIESNELYSIELSTDDSSLLKSIGLSVYIQKVN